MAPPAPAGRVVTERSRSTLRLESACPPACLGHANQDTGPSRVCPTRCTTQRGVARTVSTHAVPRRGKPRSSSGGSTCMALAARTAVRVAALAALAALEGSRSI